MTMKKLLLMTMMLVCAMTFARAENQAEIKFDNVVHNFGTIAKDAVVTCTFTFTNTGDQPLIINQAMATCGCTVPEYTKAPIQPGEKGTIKVTYNSQGKMAGHFKKSITVRTNAVPEMTRLYIEGEMSE